MTRRRLVLAAAVGSTLLLAAGLVPTVSSAPAGGGSLVREVVVSVLEPNGDIRSTSVLHLIRLGPGTSASIPRADLDGYRTLSGFDAAAEGADAFEWRTTGQRDVLALAGVDNDPPLDVEVTYSLDGERVSADELHGASGDVRIEIRLGNVSGRVTTLTHDAVSEPLKTGTASTFVPLEYSVRTALPTQEWTHVRVTDGLVQPDSSGDQIVVVSGLLSPPATPPSQTIVIEATSERIVLPRIQIFAFARANPLVTNILDQQVQAITQIYGGVDQIGANMAKISAGVVDLATGLQTILDGVGRLSSPGGDPVAELDAAGDPATLLAALGLLGDTLSDRILAGLGSRDRETGDPVVTIGDDGEPTTLLGALGFLEQAVREDLLPSLGRRIATGRAEVAVDDVGRALTLLWGLQSLADTFDTDLIDGVDELIAAIDSLIASVSSLDADDPGLVEGLGAIQGELVALIAQLDVVAGEPGSGFREGLEGISQLAQLGAATTTDPASAPVFAQIGAVATQLLGGLGERNPDGTPKITLDGDGNPETIIGTLGFLRAALTGQIIPALGTRDPATGDPVVVLGPDGDPVTLLGALGAIRDTALSNPSFDTEQSTLGNRTPRAYFNACPACFDPDHAKFDPATIPFQPGFREAFELFSAGLDDTIERLHSFDADSPGLVDGLGALADGVSALAAELHTFDPGAPGLVDGIEQVDTAIDDIAASLHTFDPDDPGLVDGLELASGGADAIGEGLAALRSQGVDVLRSQLGASGDDLALDLATARRQATDLDDYSFLAQDADVTSTAFLLEIPAGSTATRDNTVRGGLIAAGLAALALLRRRFGVPV